MPPAAAEHKQKTLPWLVTPPTPALALLLLLTHLLQAGIGNRLLQQGSQYAHFSGKDDLAVILDLSGTSTATAAAAGTGSRTTGAAGTGSTTAAAAAGTGSITLGGVTYTRLEVSLDGDEAFGFKEGVPGFTSIEDARLLRKVDKGPLLGVSHNVSEKGGWFRAKGDLNLDLPSHHTHHTSAPLSLDCRLCRLCVPSQFKGSERVFTTSLRVLGGTQQGILMSWADLFFAVHPSSLKGFK